MCFAGVCATHGRLDPRHVGSTTKGWVVRILGDQRIVYLSHIPWPRTVPREAVARRIYVLRVRRAEF